MSERASKRKGLLWLLAAVGLAVAAAGAFPWLVRHVPWTVERWLAAGVGGAPGSAICRGGAPQAQADLAELVARIYPLLPGDARLPITVEVIHDRQVNAFATLGGHIYVAEGLLAQARSPEELAGVIAHEIEHVRNRHILQSVAMHLIAEEALEVFLPTGGGVDPRIAGLFLNLQFGRKEEAEADELGLERLRAAQVDSKGFAQFFARARKLPELPPILSNHPSSESREALAARFGGYPVRPVLEPAAWARLASLCR